MRRVTGFMLLLLVLLSACAPTTDVDQRSETQGLPSIVQDLVGYEWVLNGSASNPSFDPSQTVTLSFSTDGTSLNGFGPCNSYRADLSVDRESIKISNLLSTNRACDPATSAAENTYFSALQQVTSEQRHDDSQLTLHGADGIKLVYDVYDVRTALAGTWNIVNYATPNALISPVSNTQPVIVINSNGHLVLQSGCNNLNGYWKLSGNLFDVYHFNSLKQEPGAQSPCSSDVVEQENQLVAALKGATSLQVIPHSLSMFRADGGIVLIGSNAT